jgi:hypothetical protein
MYLDDLANIDIKVAIITIHNFQLRSCLRHALRSPFQLGNLESTQWTSGRIPHSLPKARMVLAWIWIPHQEDRALNPHRKVRMISVWPCHPPPKSKTILEWTQTSLGAKGTLVGRGLVPLRANTALAWALRMMKRMLSGLLCCSQQCMARGHNHSCHNWRSHYFSKFVNSRQCSASIKMFSLHLSQPTEPTLCFSKPKLLVPVEEDVEA